MANNNLIFGLEARHYADIAQILDKFSVDRVVIYGSRAQGSAKPASDFDLAIVAPGLDDSQFSQLWLQLTSLPLVFKLDIVHWDTLVSASLKNKIARDGKTFYPLASGETPGYR